MAAMSSARAAKSEGCVEPGVKRRCCIDTPPWCGGSRAAAPDPCREFGSGPRAPRIHVWLGDPIGPEEAGLATDLARYVVKPPIALERMEGPLDNLPGQLQIGVTGALATGSRAVLHGGPLGSYPRPRRARRELSGLLFEPFAWRAAEGGSGTGGNRSATAASACLPFAQGPSHRLGGC